MPEEPLRCFRCGAQIPENAEHCPGCGRPVMRVRSTPEVSWHPPGEPAPAGAPAGAPAALETPPVPEVIAVPRTVYAGFWLRALAYIVDTIVLGAITAPVLFWLLPQGPQLREQFSRLSPNDFFNLSSPEARSVMVVALPVILVIGWIYFALYESSRWQATPGKRLLGLAVTDVDGRRIGFGRASARYFGKLLSGQLFGFGYILAGFTRRKQALHDFIAHCLVIRRR